MKIETRVADGVTVASVAERLEIDVSNVADFKSSVSTAIDDAERVVLDISRVEFFDSAGLGALLSLKKLVGERRGQMVLCSADKAVTQIFEMVGFDVVFHTFRDLPSALEFLGRSKQP